MILRDHRAVRPPSLADLSQRVDDLVDVPSRAAMTGVQPSLIGRMPNEPSG